jgi:hypothetical protein
MKQNKQFGKKKNHKVPELNNNNKGIYKSKFNYIQEKPKIGFDGLSHFSYIKQVLYKKTVKTRN